MLPVAGLSWLVHQDHELTFDDPVTVVTAVLPESGEIVSWSQLGLLWRAPAPLFAPGWEGGVVQRVLAEDGGVVHDGDVLATVDGIDRVVWSTPRPFSRPLGLGDTGEDVWWLIDELRAHGSLDPGPSADVVDQKVLAAIRGLAATLGVPAADEVTAFDPAWIVYAPADSIVVASIDLTVGAQAPSAGSVLVQPAPTLIQARLVETGSLARWAGDLPDGSGPTEAEVMIALEQSGAQVPSGASLTHAGRDLPLSPDGSSVTPDGLALLSEVTDPGTVVLDVQVREPSRAGAFRVPPAAVAVDQGGRTCVHLVTTGGHGDGARAVLVSVVDSAQGYILVEGAGLDESSRVRVPSGLVSCPSS